MTSTRKLNMVGIIYQLNYFRNSIKSPGHCGIIKLMFCTNVLFVKDFNQGGGLGNGLYINVMIVNQFN